MRKGTVVLLIIAAIIIIVGLTPLMIGAVKGPGAGAPITDKLNADNNGDKTPAAPNEIRIRGSRGDKDDKTPAALAPNEIRIRGSRGSKDDKTPAMNIGAGTDGNGDKTPAYFHTSPRRQRK